MRWLWSSILLLSSVVSPIQTAKFVKDGVTSTPSAVVAIIEPRTGAPGYSWIRVYFYSSLTAAERASAAKGLVESIRTPWAAALQFTLDQTTTVWQVDLSLPGLTCTVADSDAEARKAFQEFRFDGRRLRLKGSGSYACVIGTTNRRLEWEVDVDAPVADRRRPPQP